MHGLVRTLLVVAGMSGPALALTPSTDIADQVAGLLRGDDRPQDNLIAWAAREQPADGWTLYTFALVDVDAGRAGWQQIWAARRLTQAPGKPVTVEGTDSRACPGLAGTVEALEGLVARPFAIGKPLSGDGQRQVVPPSKERRDYAGLRRGTETANPEQLTLNDRGERLGAWFTATATDLAPCWRPAGAK